jgi:putative hydrolase
VKIIADPHTHTIVSGHAFSTLHENASAAARIGLKYLCATEHTGVMPGAPNAIYFHNKRSFPTLLEGVHIVFGCEVNIVDLSGTLDLSDGYLDSLDWVIASMHGPCLKPGTREQHTEAWLAVARNPLVDVIGHCGTPQYSFDYEPVIKEFAAQGKIVEINSHSFSGARPGSEENCAEIARLCRKYQVPVVVSSDAHSELDVGNFSAALELLEKIHFPEELVLNANEKRFAAALAAAAGKTGL